MKMVRFAAVVNLIFTFFLQGCSSVSDLDSAKTLESNTWHLGSMNSVNISLSSGKDITLEFNRNSQGISGFGGCNRYFGEYLLYKDSLLFSRIGSTEIACNDLKTETDYYSLLKKTDKYKITLNRLTLYSKGTAIMVFNKKE